MNGYYLWVDEIINSSTGSPQEKQDEKRETIEAIASMFNRISEKIKEGETTSVEFDVLHDYYRNVALTEVFLIVTGVAKGSDGTIQLYSSLGTIVVVL